MIVKGFRRNRVQQEAESNGFDAFDLRLGDMMRGERATMGKSLLDVQRELKIKAAYIAAIENADPTAFDTPGFIAGYVRSYARYLNMDPDWAFDTFCGESGFVTAHGMSAEASAAKPSTLKKSPAKGNDIFSSSATPFIPSGDAMFSRIEPGAIGSVLVLVALIGGIGYGGYTVLQEVQRVQFAPVEQTPTVVSDIDPLAGGANIAPETEDVASFTAPSVEALDRLYRPAALDVPVLVSRDGPIASLNPGTFGVASNEATPTTDMTAVERALAEAVGGLPPVSGVQVLETPAPAVQMVAVRPAWVRVKAADGTTIFEATMQAGDTFNVPQTESPATLRVGESGAIYFAINGTHYGPAGPRGQVTSNLAMSVDGLTASYTVADITSDSDLAEVVRVAEVIPAAQ
ncbi:cytoskeletal protein RodZ [Loktanella ponticola]|uniref:Cytoskeletal protein RodZ n=1 Tax=Yoonia ponticola TaxID=1524255 RepID=A0A7W9BKI3_9RHOB|nr:RodZ domain-containing protein [Yoonia ponticola]MBB5721754.1 cytoskeletal protein RodZ [Yoonia ponticola]